MDTTPAGRALLQMQAAFAKTERDLIRHRIKEGLTAAVREVSTIGKDQAFRSSVEGGCPLSRSLSPPLDRAQSTPPTG
jgi:hypothetical protein